MNEDELIAYEQDRFEARYFGTMGPEEVASFERELQHDEQLAARYHAFRMAMEAVEGSGGTGRADVKEHLATIDRDMDENAGPRNVAEENAPAIVFQQASQHVSPHHRKEERIIDQDRSSRTWRVWAAAAMLVVALAAWWLLREPSYVRLADEFELPEPGLPVLMNDGAGAYDHIMNHLKTGRLDQARSAIDLALLDRPSNDTLMYFAGIVEERSDDLAKAIDRFRSVPASSSYASKSRYHEAICHLRAGDKDQARTLMLSLQNDKDPQVRDRAMRLLEQL